MTTIVLKNILPFLWAFLVAVFAIPAIISVAHTKQLLDKPNDRTMHLQLTPRLGGLAIFAGFTSALTIFGIIEGEVQYLLAGCVILFFIGLKDDIVSVSAFKKFFVQMLASGIIMFMADLRIRSFQGVLGIYELEDGISYMLTFVLIVGITNAVNLIDGLDGLAGSIISLACLTFGIVFSMQNDTMSLACAIVAFSLMGSTVGFLWFNFYKARIFMGDTGSLLAGYILAVLALKLIDLRPVVNTPALSLAILLIPILDTTRVFLLRILNGTSPFAPDRNHIHHRLILMGFSPLQTVFVLIGINVLAIGMVLYFTNLSQTMMILFLGVYALFFSSVIHLSSAKKYKEQKVASSCES